MGDRPYREFDFAPDANLFAGVLKFNLSAFRLGFLRYRRRFASGVLEQDLRIRFPLPRWDILFPTLYAVQCDDGLQVLGL